MIVAANGVKNTFKSAKSWLLANYTPKLGTYKDYDSFHKDFSAGACDRTTTSTKLPDIKGKYIYKKGLAPVVSFTDYDVTPCSAFASPSNKNAVLIFIEGDLQISASMPALKRPTAFIVKGNISIAGGCCLNGIGGMYLANGNFDTGSSNQKLIINGSVAAALSTGSLTFGRTYTNALGDEPAEVINFDPRYLYLLADFLGTTSSTYREDNP